MHVFNGCSEDFLSESIELILGLMLIIFDSIAVGIDDVSVNLCKAACLNFLIL